MQTNAQNPRNPFSLDHYSGLCVTGGIIGAPEGNLDAPLFSPAGSHISPDLQSSTAPVQTIVILDGRLV